MHKLLAEIHYCQQDVLLHHKSTCLNAFNYASILFLSSSDGFGFGAGTGAFAGSKFDSFNLFATL